MIHLPRSDPPGFLNLERQQLETKLKTLNPAPFETELDEQIHQQFDARSVRPSFVHWRRVRTVSDSEEYQLMPSTLVKQHWYDWIVELFKQPGAEKLAYREYEEARRSLLQCQKMRDYYDNMVKFESQRIRRLQKMLRIDGE